MALSRIERGEIGAGHAVLLAIAVADCCLFDEMRPTFDEGYPWSDGAAPYHRFFAYESFVPARVASALTERHPGYEHVLIGAPEQVLALAQGSDGAGMLTADLAYWVNSSKPLPPCSVPRQALYASLLACGVDSFEGPSRAPPQPPGRGAMPRHVKKSARLARWLAASRPDVDAVLARTARHWGAMMAEGAPEIAAPAVLMSSGSAANESVVLSLSRIAAGIAFVDPGFYFENIRSITDRCFTGRVTQDIGLATIFFLNLEPITFCRPIATGERPESALPLLEAICKLAAAAPERAHHVVLDVTASPTMSVRSTLSTSIPPNVVLYKTSSITKHQDGSRNYTCGAVAIQTADPARRALLEADLLDARRVSGGDIHSIHALNIPRTTRRSIEDKRDRISRLNRAVCHALDPGRQGRVVPYTYHSFLLPSREALHRLASETLALALAGGLRARRAFELRAGPYLHERSRLLSARLREIEYGNSFGLPRSRIIHQDCAALDVCVGLRISVCVFRLCPGYEADEDHLIAEARLVQEYLEESFVELADMASAIRQTAIQDWVLHG